MVATSANTPHVLPDDLEAIEELNCKAHEEHRFRLDVLPEPFLGNLDAPVVLLNLNPAFKDHNVENHKRPEFIRASRAQHEHASAEHPFYLLDPALGFDGGHRWWSKRLRRPIETLGRHAVASGVFNVEFFPYQSRRSGITARHRVPSKDYSFHLVKRAMDRQAIVVMLRSKKLWFGAIPELTSYPNLYELKSKQNVSLSPKNCPEGYEAILQAIRSAA